MNVANEMAKILKGQANKDSPSRVFDWVKAAKMIVLSSPSNVGAGLGTDWSYTGGTIYEDGEPDMEPGTFLSSNWAIPEIDMDGTVEPCWVWEADSEWDSDTVWPPEALAILKGEDA